MSGSKKRGKGEHRATQSSVKRESGKSDKEEDFLVCSCGATDSNEKTTWKEDSVEEKNEAPEKDGIEKSKELEKVQAATLMVENVEVRKESETSEKVKSKEDLIAVKIEDSGTEEKVISHKNSLEETIEEESVSPLMTSNEYASMKERLNSTSFSEDNYRTPLLSPDLWPQEDADEIHEALQKMKFEESSIKEPDEVENWYRAEKSLEADWSRSADRELFVEDIERHVVEENENAEYTGAVEGRKHPSVVQPESTPYYDRLAADMLMSVIESHRDALNDQKVLLARQTDAIDRLATAVEQQTKMISTLNENKVPRTY